MRPVLLLVSLLLVACAGEPVAPSADPPGPPSATPRVSGSPPAPAPDHGKPPDRPSRTPYADLPVGAPPEVPYVVRQVLVSPDGARTRIQRGYEHGVSGFVRVGHDAVLLEDADNIEGYTTVRLVRSGRPAGRWNTYGGLFVGRDGAVAFGEATWSEAVRHGPVALHLVTGGRHLVQRVEQHPMVHAIVGDRIVFEYRWPGDGGVGPFVTDLVSPPQRWTRSVPERTYDVPTSVSEPGGARLDIVDIGERSGIVRTQDDGVRDVTAPFVRRAPEGLAISAYSFELAPSR